MPHQTRVELSATTIGTPDVPALAAFYQRLLGWSVVEDSPEWVTLRPTGGGAGLSFQLEERHEPPSWPPVPGRQQMMMHLDLQVDDLAAASEHALSCGATLATYQPQEHVRVLLDPVGHPFCLFLHGA